MKLTVYRKMIIYLINKLNLVAENFKTQILKIKIIKFKTVILMLKIIYYNHINLILAKVVLHLMILNKSKI